MNLIERNPIPIKLNYIRLYIILIICYKPILIIKQKFNQTLNFILRIFKKLKFFLEIKTQFRTLLF